MRTGTEMNMKDLEMVNGGMLNIYGGKDGVNVDVCKDNEKKTVVKHYEVKGTDFIGIYKTMIKAQEYAEKHNYSTEYEMELRY